MIIVNIECFGLYGAKFNDIILVPDCDEIPHQIQ